MAHICKQNEQGKINHFERAVEKRVEETVTKTFSIVQSNTIYMKKENNYMSTSDFDAITFHFKQQEDNNNTRLK